MNSAITHKSKIALGELLSPQFVYIQDKSRKLSRKAYLDKVALEWSSISRISTKITKSNISKLSAELNVAETTVTIVAKKNRTREATMTTFRQDSWEKTDGFWLLETSKVLRVLIADGPWRTKQLEKP